MAGHIDSALHDPTEEQEVRAAMESVFPFSMLAQFLTLPRSDKEMQLCELPYIVMGICLFNQATGSSEGKALTTALESSLSVDTSALLRSCEDHIHTTTRVLHCYTGTVCLFIPGKEVTGEIPRAQSFIAYDTTGTVHAIHLGALDHRQNAAKLTGMLANVRTHRSHCWRPRICTRNNFLAILGHYTPLLVRKFVCSGEKSARGKVLWAAGSLESLSDDSVKAECLLWFQARTYLQQLHAAIATSIQLLDKLARELLDMVSEVQAMVKEMKAVPKQTILPQFYRIGQHFEVLNARSITRASDPRLQ